MERDLQGYHVSDQSLNDFPSFFESWFEVIHDYEEKTRFGEMYGDSIYWYNERANVGAFASALSRNKISVIEEYTCQKGEGNNRRLGRADISFFCHDKWYLAEAKIHWRKISPPSKIVLHDKIVSKSLGDAKDSWLGDSGTIPLGLNFIVPYIDPSCKSNVSEYVMSCIEQLEKVNTDFFWAYCAPGRLRYIQSSRKGNYYYPMVVMIGSKCPVESHERAASSIL